MRGYKEMENAVPVTVARGLRQKQTEAEKLLWFKLRNKQLGGVKFRRQQPIGNYIVDFICFEKKLIIEIDGGQHNEALIKENDIQRTKWLEAEGYRVLRFWNSDVMNNAEGVLESISGVLTRETHPHLTSPIKGEEQIVREGSLVEGEE